MAILYIVNIALLAPRTRILYNPMKCHNHNKLVRTILQAFFTNSAQFARSTEKPAPEIPERVSV